MGFWGQPVQVDLASGWICRHVILAPSLPLLSSAKEEFTVTSGA